MMTEEGEVEVGVQTMSTSTEHVHDSSPSKRTCSNVAAGSSITIDQMVRDFIIAKTIGMNGNDRGADGKKAEPDHKGHRKSNKDKKKKKKKKHKSHHKESGSKHRRDHHRDHRSPDASSENNLGDEGRQQCISNTAGVEEKSAEANRCVEVDDNKMKDDPLTPTKKNDECGENSPTSEESVDSTKAAKSSLNSGVCSKCSCGRQIILLSEQKIKPCEVQCHCSSLSDDKIVIKNERFASQHKGDAPIEIITSKPDKDCQDKREHVESASYGKHFVNEASQVAVKVSSDSHHSREAVCHSHKGNTLPHKHVDETRKLTRQNGKHEGGVSSKSRHNIDSNKMSDCATKQHSSREHRCTRDGSGRDKPTSSRKSSPSLGKVSDKRSLPIEDGQSDDVVFVKKVSAHDALKSISSRETVSNREKSSRQQKSSRKTSRSIAVDDSGKDGIKRRHDSRSSEDDTVLQCKIKKDRKQTKDSPVILLSDDDVDVLSDEMVEKLHKRLTTSIKKSKELQAERELHLAADLKTDEPETSHGTKLIGEPVCCDAAETQNLTTSTSANLDIILPADSASNLHTSSCESVNTGEQSVAAKSAASGLLGKKTLKFGLKITESSAAWISKGIKSSQGTGKKVQFCCLFIFY